MFGVVLVQMFEGERRAGAISQQPFQPEVDGAFDAAAHLVTITLRE
jgi:hypothetical protein